MIPLFEKPDISCNVPRIARDDFLTPVIKLDDPGKHLGVDQLYLKNDGGNKVRKLEFILTEALERGAQKVMTVGYAGLNHALTTAVYANKLGMRSISMLLLQENAKYVQENLLTSFKFGAKLHHYKNRASLRSGIKYHLKRQKEMSGKDVYFIPVGGSYPPSLYLYRQSFFSCHPRRRKKTF